ncbi:MAG: phospholipase D-like domain-containing protein [Pseudomonadota bacterium]
MAPYPAASVHWPFPLTALEHGSFVFAGLLIYVLVTRAAQQHRHPSAAIAWVMIIGLFPYIGIPLFLLFGSRKFVRPGHKPPISASINASEEAPVWAMESLNAMDIPPPTHNSSIVFHKDGIESREALVSLIEGAQRSIDLCTFILRADVIGAAVVDSLIGRARQGVRVRVLLDAIGSMQISRRQIASLRQAGVVVRWFMPVLHNPLRGRLNLRNHRKLLVIDDAYLWSGGRNLAAEYFIDIGEFPAWVDLSFVVHGALAMQAKMVFDLDWHAASGKRREAHRKALSHEPPDVFFAQSHQSPGALESTELTNSACAQLVPSGPDHADDTVYALLLAAAYHARHRIMAVTPYFVPDEALLAAWCMACRRGVQLTLVLPKRSNHRLADLARERALRALVDAGAQVYLSPAMIHAKAVVIDGELALCGSVNLDGRSLFLNFELMTAFYSPTQIEWLATWTEQQVLRSSAYQASPPSWGRDVVEGVVRAVGFQL